LGKQRRFIYYSPKKKKKKARNGAVLKRHHLLLPLDARNRGRRRFFFLPLSSPSNLQKDVASPLKDADLPTTFHVLDGRWRGGSTVATPTTSPSPVFAYKNKGRGRKKKGPGREGRERSKNRTREEQRRGRGRKKKKQRRERRKKEKHRRLCRPQLPSSTAGHRKPPEAPPLQVNPPPFYFGLHFFPRHARRAQCMSTREGRSWLLCSCTVTS
jgi:hypothetical protein